MKSTPLIVSAILAMSVESVGAAFNYTVAPTTMVTSTLTSVAAPTVAPKLALKAAPIIVGMVDSYVYNGCWTEGIGGLALGDIGFTWGLGVTVEKCINACKTHGFGIAGMEYGQVCYCAAQFENGSKLVNDHECAISCAGNHTEVCGGEGRLTTYKSG